MADETTQGAHPFTVKWWNRLPAVYRSADRVQGYRRADAWHGLNRDPRFITGMDGWHRANTSTLPWVSSVAFSRTFRSTPHVPIHIRTWHNPVGIDPTDTGTSELGIGKLGAMRLGVMSQMVRVRHVILNHTGNIVAQQTWRLDGTVQTRQSFVTTVEPDRFGVLAVRVEVSIGVPDVTDFMRAVHVGPEDVTDFGLLPDVDYFSTAAAYPLLRYMDGIGHQAGFLSDMANDMHEGRYTDPVTAPDTALPFLAAVMGVPTRYANGLEKAQLREHLVAIKEGNSPASGSRQAIALTAKQYVTGSKNVGVYPAHAVPGFATTDPVHTLIVLAKANEVPNNDLQAFENFLNEAGVIPAGHRVVVREATQSWNAWEAAVGASWATYEARTKTWNDNDSIAVSL